MDNSGNIQQNAPQPPIIVTKPAPKSNPIEEEKNGPLARPTTGTDSASAEELNRVRELLLGPDLVTQRMRGAEVTRLRDIIFGEEIQQYERRFTDMQRNMERVLSDLRQMQDRMVEFERAQTQRVENLERDTSRSDDELRRDVTRLRSLEVLLQQLHTQVRKQDMAGQQSQDSVGELRKILTQTEQDLRSVKSGALDNRTQFDRKIDDLKREMRLGSDNLLAELRRVTDRLDNQKTDRKSLASMLIEVATRLETGSNVTGLLENLTPPAQE